MFKFKYNRHIIFPIFLKIDELQKYEHAFKLYEVHKIAIGNTI